MRRAVNIGVGGAAFFYLSVAVSCYSALGNEVPGSECSLHAFVCVLISGLGVGWVREHARRSLGAAACRATAECTQRPPPPPIAVVLAGFPQAPSWLLVWANMSIVLHMCVRLLSVCV